MFQLLLLLLPVAAISGWYAGYRHKKTIEIDLSVVQDDYFLGLNYLINEQPDKAVDVFIKMLEVNSDTVETHLALGSLFRRRGEVDRAIRIHQNLIARPQLDRKQRIQALFELAQDYLRAGVLDRAERLFLELIELEGDIISSLNNLINIYQQQKDWQQAIATAKKLSSLSNININNAIAHYYCELAEQLHHDHRNQQAHEYLKEALSYDKHCTRASIILGKFFIESGEYKQAIHAFLHVYEQNAEYMSEVIVLLADCYKKISCEEEFVGYLSKYIAENPRICFVLAMTDYICDKQGDMAAIEYLSNQSHRLLSMRGLRRMLGLYINSVDPDTKDKLLLLKEFIDKLSEHKPIYRCTHCGLAGKQLYWQCPGCKRWNSVKPIHGLEGD
jgi:lipopolysaccharide biosynthesis regulator YciM